MSTSSSASTSSSSLSSSNTPSTNPEDDLDLDIDPLEQSAYFRRLKARDNHCETRIREITRAGRRSLPPEEPPSYACCGSSCGLDCVVTVWWEEEKVWRDCHEDWKEIRERLKEEEEDRKREEEERREGMKSGGPRVKIGIEEVVEELEKVKVR